MGLAYHAFHIITDSVPSACLYVQTDDLEVEPKQAKAKWYRRISWWQRALPVLATCYLLVIAALFRKFGPGQVSTELQEAHSRLMCCLLHVSEHKASVRAVPHAISSVKECYLGYRGRIKVHLVTRLAGCVKMQLNYERVLPA